MMEEAEWIYYKMPEASIRPGTVCRRMILKGYSSCGDAEKGILFYEKMIKRSLEDDRFVKQLSLKLLVKNKSFDKHHFPKKISRCFMLCKNKEF